MNRIRTGVYAPLVLSMTLLLSACGLAPGQRMITPAALPDTGGEYSTEAEQQIQIPITDINLSLVRKMKGQTTDLSQQTVGLFSNKPPVYKIGPGDVLQITVWDHPELAAALSDSRRHRATRTIRGSAFSSMPTATSSSRMRARCVWRARTRRRCRKSCIKVERGLFEA